GTRLHGSKQPAPGAPSARPAPAKALSGPAAFAAAALPRRLFLLDHTAVEFGQHRTLPISLFACRRALEGPSALEEASPLQVAQIAGRREEAVRMIDAETCHRSLTDEAEDQPVGLLEDRRLFHPDRRQFIDVEEAPVADLIAGYLPEGQAVRLRG